MQLINGPVEYRALDEIIVDETRQRKDIKRPALEELKRSIETHGLLHPVVVSEKRLVSGRRRMLAITELHAEAKPVFFGDYPVPRGMLPVVEKADLDPTTRKEIELDENLKRVDLTWQEKANALAELHALRTAQNPEQSHRDTANEIAAATGGNAPYLQQSVQAAVLIQPFLDNPEVKRAPTLQAARNIVIKNLEAEFAKSHKPTIKSTEFNLIHGTFASVSATLRAEQFDCIIADPPYGIGADTFGSASRLLHGYDDSEAGARKLVCDILWGTRPLAKPDAHLYMFCDPDYFKDFRDVAASAGWRVWRTPLIWHKPGEGHAPDPRRGPRRNYEFILYAWQGNRFVREVRSDVITCAPEQDKQHAAQKPVALYCELASRSCLAGEHLFDPCAGSGTVFAAAKALNMRATGIEADEKYHAIASHRIANLG